jgi:hypothetical protein
MTAMITRCVPCVSIWTNPETNETNYVADIRFSSTIPPPLARKPRRSLHETKQEAFAELVAGVKKLPELLQDFEIVVKDKTYTNATEAALAVEQDLPMSEDLAKA